MLILNLRTDVSMANKAAINAHAVVERIPF